MANSIYNNSISVWTTIIQVFTSQTRSNFNNWLYIKAMPTNTGIVYVWDLNVSTSNWFPLSSWEGIYIPLDKLWDVYLISDTSAQSVRYLNAY